MFSKHGSHALYPRKPSPYCDELFISQTYTGEQKFKLAWTLICNNAIEVLLPDAVAGWVSKKGIEEEVAAQMQIEFIRHGPRKLSGDMSTIRARVIFIKKCRMKIDVIFGYPGIICMAVLTSTRGWDLAVLASSR